MTERQLYPLKPDYSCPPGETLLEMLEDRQMAVSTLSALSGLSEQDVVGLLAGNVKLTESMAAALEQALGISSGTWLRLEKHWRDYLARDAARVRKTA